jgi:hypothetical protein
MEPEPVAEFEKYELEPVLNAKTIFEVKNRCEPFAVTFEYEFPSDAEDAPPAA